MAFPILRKLFSQNPLASGRSRRKRLDPARPRRGAALVLEPLEDRLAPATNISIIAGAAGAGNLDHFLGAGNGTITAASDPGDTAATLSVGALQGVGAGANTQVGSTSTAVGQAINATATGNIVVNALRGTTVNLTSNTGSVNSSGSQSVQASAQLTVSAATGIALNTLAAALQAGNS